MQRFWKNSWILGLMILPGCFGTDDASEPIIIDDRIVTPSPEAVDDRKADVLAPRHLVDLLKPASGYCAESPLITEPDLENVRVGQPVITERFGADGCLDERWIQEWDGAQPLHDFYDFFDPDIARYVYVLPIKYSHRYEYDDDGRVTGETRAHEVDGEPFYFETTAYDDAGRTIEIVRLNNPIQPDFSEGTHREIWTFGDGDEFSSHTTYRDGELTMSERREYRPTGEIEREFYTRGNADEILARSNAYDTNGALIEFDTWERYTGNPDTHTTIERRADGTMLRKTEKNLRLGWLNEWEYDAAEQEVLYTQDEREDGSIDYRKITRYDAAGNIVFTSTEYDFDAPATRYAQTVSTFDAQSRMIEMRSTQVWMDGTTLRTGFDYDSSGAGYVVTSDVLQANGQLVRLSSVARYRAPYQLLWRRGDNDRDGVLDSLEVERWDSDRRLERLADHDGDGYLDAISQWHYDAAGQLVESLEDVDADGIVDSREAFAR